MWDVIVIGGGPAGSHCAAALARGGWRVLLVDGGDFTGPKMADTLGPTASRCLQRALPAGVGLESVGVRCRGLLAQWGSPYPSVTDYELEQCGPGYVVARPAVDRLLFQRAGQDGAALRLSWKCRRIHASERHAPVRVDFRTPDGARTEESRLVVVATGRASIPGTPGRIYVDRQLAYAATVDEAVQTHDLLWVESSAGGWWYLVRLSASSAQIVFVTERRPVGAGRQAREQFFKRAFERTALLRASFQTLRVDRISVHDARASRPACASAERVLLIGDAAGTVDPLSGQGWMQALQSADAAAEHLSQCLRGSRALDARERHEIDATRFARHLAGRRSMLARSPFEGLS